VITISEEQLAQVEYLFEQSSRGNHVLFDPRRLRAVFRTKTSRRETLGETEAQEVERHIERLLAEPTLDDKKAYLASLDRSTYGWVVRTYFSILESNLAGSLAPEARH
jgi:hypothetical protein